MNLLGLCEPLFQYVCRLDRSAQKGCAMEIERVRNEIEQIFQEMKSKASTDQNSISQYSKVEMPLIFFVDSMIKQSKLNFSSDWIELARKREELAGDEKFFDLLDAELADSSNAATERLSIYYTCLGLGFTGFYTGDPETIRRLMSRISARISGMMDSGQRSYICPQAYEGVDRRDFVEPPGKKLAGIVIVLLCLIVVWFVAYFCLFQWAVGGAREAIKNIVASEQPQSSNDK